MTFGPFFAASCMDCSGYKDYSCSEIDQDDIQEGIRDMRMTNLDPFDPSHSARTDSLSAAEVTERIDGESFVPRLAGTANTGRASTPSAAHEQFFPYHELRYKQSSGRMKWILCGLGLTALALGSAFGYQESRKQKQAALGQMAFAGGVADNHGNGEARQKFNVRLADGRELIVDEVIGNNELGQTKLVLVIPSRQIAQIQPAGAGDNRLAANDKNQGKPANQAAVPAPVSTGESSDEEGQGRHWVAKDWTKEVVHMQRQREARMRQAAEPAIGLIRTVRNFLGNLGIPGVEKLDKAIPPAPPEPKE